MVITLAMAWSSQFPQFYHAFPSPTPPPPLALRQFFQEPSQRYFVHQSQRFRQPLELYQPLPQPLPQLLPQPQQLLNARRPKVQPPPLHVLPAPPATHRVTTTDIHHHVFYYYYYLPVGGETFGTTGRRGDDGGQVAPQPCGNQHHHPVTTSECPHPVYLPPPTTLPPPPPSQPPQSSPTTTSVSPPMQQAPCDDDTVIVDNVDYYPFSRSPIVVATTKSVRDGSENASRNSGSAQQKYRHGSQPNFILANYLLPPDK